MKDTIQQILEESLSIQVIPLTVPYSPAVGIIIREESAYVEGIDSATELIRNFILLQLSEAQKNLPVLLTRHPDQAAVKAACLHYLGDKYQAMEAENQALREEVEKLKKMYAPTQANCTHIHPKLGPCRILYARMNRTAWVAFSGGNSDVHIDDLTTIPSPDSLNGPNK